MQKPLIVATAVLIALSAPAAPQGQPAPSVQRVKLRALLTEGYEIRNVAIMPQDVASRVAGKLDVDVVILSLQKASQLATCYYRLDNYLTGVVLDIEWCIAHK